jgi:hypothetical protein
VLWDGLINAVTAMGKWEEEEKGWFEEVGLVIPPTSEPPI